MARNLCLRLFIEVNLDVSYREGDLGILILRLLALDVPRVSNISGRYVANWPTYENIGAATTGTLPEELLQAGESILGATVAPVTHSS